MLQGWGSNFIEKIIKDDGLFLTESTTEYIQKVDEQEDIALYVLKHKDDLIKALIDGYEAEENKYIVVAKTPYSLLLSTLTLMDVFPKYLTKPYGKIKIYYVDDEQQEDHIIIQEDVLHYGLITGEFSSHVISLLHEKPESIMNKEEAEKLMNSYRVMIPVKS